jgi:SnoaL-like protein
MTDVERLMAIYEISHLKARYFRCMDTKDWSGFEAVFAADAVADYTPPGGDQKEWMATGAGNIVAFVRKVVAPAITVHHGHMPEIEVTSPTTANGIWSMEDLIWWPEGSRRKSLHGFGHYHETYQKIGDRWLIKTLKLTRLRVVE